MPLALALVLTACSGLAGGPGGTAPASPGAGGSGGSGEASGGAPGASPSESSGGSSSGPVGSSRPGRFSGKPIIGPTAHPVPAGRTYISIGVEADGVAKPLVGGTSISLTFSADTIRASAGCNTFGASYHLDGLKLIVSDGAETAMGCDGPRMDQDTWLFGFLQAGPALSWPDVKHLTLTSGSTVIRLADRELADADQPLTGRTWTLDGLVSGQTASSVPSSVKASITFDADGTFSFDSGCNAGGGRYVATPSGSASSGSLTFSRILSTMLACRALQASVEGAFRAVVRAGVTVSYAIQGTQLRLSSGDQALDFRS